MSSVQKILNIGAGPKPADLPTVLAILNVHDGGPCDGGYGSATCPHCGAEGRYIIEFLCDDGSTRGAMKGCFQLFRGSNTLTSKLVQEAFERKRAAKENKTKLASWWADMIAEVADFKANGGPEDFQLFCNNILAIDARRQAWLSKNGYGRFGRRGRA